MHSQTTSARVAPDLPALGRAVRELRVVRFISQEELGARASLHRNYVGAIERGTINPTLRTLVQVAHGLTVPLSGLVVLYERNATESRAIPPPLAP